MRRRARHEARQEQRETLHSPSSRSSHRSSSSSGGAQYCSRSRRGTLGDGRHGVVTSMDSLLTFGCLRDYRARRGGLEHLGLDTGASMDSLRPTTTNRRGWTPQGPVGRRGRQTRFAVTLSTHGRCMPLPYALQQRVRGVYREQPPHAVLLSSSSCGLCAAGARVTSLRAHGRARRRRGRGGRRRGIPCESHGTNTRVRSPAAAAWRAAGCAAR